MYVPSAREKVRLAGRPEVFFVLTVNLEEHWADMVPLNGGAHVEHCVPFALMKPYDSWIGKGITAGAERDPSEAP